MGEFEKKKACEDSREEMGEFEKKKACEDSRDEMGDLEKKKKKAREDDASREEMEDEGCCKGPEENVPEIRDDDSAKKKKKKKEKGTESDCKDGVGEEEVSGPPKKMKHGSPPCAEASDKGKQTKADKKAEGEQEPKDSLKPGTKTSGSDEETDMRQQTRNKGAEGAKKSRPPKKQSTFVTHQAALGLSASCQISASEFHDFVCARSFDIISGGMYRKFLVQSRAAKEEWAFGVQSSISKVQKQVKSISAIVHSLATAEQDLEAGESVGRDVYGGFVSEDEDADYAQPTFSTIDMHTPAALLLGIKCLGCMP